MEVKKSYRADLEHRRGLFFLIGLAVALALFVIALTVSITPGDEEVDSDLLESIVQDMEFKPNRPLDDMIAYEQPVPREPELKAKLNIVDKAVEEVPDRLVKSQEAQLDGEGAAKDSTTHTQALSPVAVDEQDNPLNFRVVERLPEFPGGPVEFMKWLTSNLKYPPSAQKAKIEGKVLVSFIVNTDGTTSDIKVLKSANSTLDREALRVFRMMPNWKAGEDKGKPCRTMMAVPVVFAL